MVNLHSICIFKLALEGSTNNIIGWSWIIMQHTWQHRHYDIWHAWNKEHCLVGWYWVGWLLVSHQLPASIFLFVTINNSCQWCPPANVLGLHLIGETNNQSMQISACSARMDGQPCITVAEKTKLETWSFPKLILIFQIWHSDF